jgi:hypothetical protein
MHFYVTRISVNPISEKIRACQVREGEEELKQTDPRQWRRRKTKGNGGKADAGQRKGRLYMHSLIQLRQVTLLQM